METASERGVALVVTLLMVALLVALILEFDAATRNELRAAANFRDGMKAYYLAKAGVSAARAVLEEDAKIDHMFNKVYDDLTEFWATPITHYPIGDGVVSIALTDETGKLNLNDFVILTEREASDSPILLDHIRRFERLFEAAAVEPEVIDAILDWVDRDDNERIHGAESRYYATLPRPYRAKNGAFDSLSELRLVKGITDRVFRALEPYVTVYPKGPGGVSAVNVNTADPIVLQALDDQGRLSESLAGDIIQARPFVKPQDLNRVSSLGQIDEKLRADQVIGVNGLYFSVQSVGTVNDTSKSVNAVVNRDGSGSTKLVYLRME